MNQPHGYISQIIIKEMSLQYLCGIQNVNYPAQNGVVFGLVFLTDQFNVSKFAEVEISLLFQTVHS